MTLEARPTLPPMPARIKRLPVSKKGYPIPYFVATVDGVPDFRLIDPNKMYQSIVANKCWCCGEPLGRHKAFVGGPLTLVNLRSIEPPSHVECAEFALKACPFLLLPSSKRRKANMPEGVHTLGMHIEDNPGVSVLYVTNQYVATRQGSDVYFRYGEPERVELYKEGRLATRQEAEEALAGSVARVNEATGQPNCEVDEKVRLIKEIAKLVGVDMKDVFDV